MWFVFPQFKGLGFSETAKFYEIKSLNEAKTYLEHNILGNRLKEISNVLIEIECNDANHIFGFPDDLKLKSCMTLFSVISNDSKSIFNKVIDKFFNNEVDYKTINLINETK